MHKEAVDPGLRIRLRDILPSTETGPSGSDCQRKVANRARRSRSKRQRDIRCLNHRSTHAPFELCIPGHVRPDFE